jgi:cytochrome P450
LAAISFPEAVQRVQAQIDSVVGRDRLPHTDDLPHLPLVKAYVLEALRWRSVTRVGVPHCLDEDDYYEGYFLPKGSVIVQNSWRSEHDPLVASLC